MFLSKGYKGYYYLYYTDELTQKRKKVTTHSKLKSTANKFLLSFKPDLFVEKSKPSVISINDIKEEVLLYAQNNLSKKSVSAYESVFKNLIRILGNREIKLISFKDLEFYKSERAKEVSKTTCNIELRTMKAIFNHAINFGSITENPAKKIKQYSLPQKERLSFNEAEIELLLSKISDINLNNIVKFGLFTGCRLNEILNAQWNDIDFENKTLMIRNKPDFKTKTGKIREIPVSNKLYDLLKALRFKQIGNVVEMQNSSEYIFTNMRGLKCDMNYISQKFKKYLRSAHFPEKFHFHCLRHTFLSMLARRGVSIYHLKQIAGHADIKTTEIYLDNTTDDLREAVNKMSI